MVLTGKVGLHSILSVGALVVALAVIMLGQVFAHEESRKSPAALQTVVSTPGNAFSDASAQRKTMVFYLVATQEQANAAQRLEDDMRTDAFNAGNEFLARTFAIYRIASQEDEVRAAQTIAITTADLSEAGMTDIVVEDLRAK